MIAICGVVGSVLSVHETSEPSPLHVFVCVTFIALNFLNLLDFDGKC